MSDFVINGNFGGYYDDSGNFVICEEYDVTDADIDAYAVDIMNGNGYYSHSGKFIRFSFNDC